MNNKRIKLYDSLTNTNKIIDEQSVNIYVCGPTVYDYLHIGNLRPLLFYDMVVRILHLTNKTVKYVVNITDIDDKIINRFYEMNHDFKTELDFSQYFVDAFMELFDVFELIIPDVIPKVSNNIEGITSFLKLLQTKDYAYGNKDLMFATNKIAAYGSLGKRKLEQNIIGERNQDQDNQKRHSNDFVLWKKTDKGLKFASPWGEGRPGWHSECSFFIYNLFNQNSLSIHGGGIDLKFPHHENERAQFFALTGKEMAKIYSYVGHVNLGNNKMSKSLNNAIYVKDLVKKFNPNTIKLFVLSSNYQKPLAFKIEILEEHHRFLAKVQNTINRVKAEYCDFMEDPILWDSSILDEFWALISNDFAMQNLLTYFQSTLKQINKALRIQNKELVLEKGLILRAIIYTFNLKLN